jgi:magnesium-protoporphyrin IX monomethyl ester (oxidative) cyclase
MYVRDHARPVFHDALGLNITDYDYQVFQITTEITKQVFPVSLDLDNPSFRRGMDTMLKISRKMAALKAKPSLFNKIAYRGLQAQAAITFARLFVMTPKRHELPSEIRLAPSW